MTTPAATIGQCLTFFLAEHQFAIPLLQVRQIIEHVSPTFVPQMPPAVRGVINLRGSLVPVVDLGARFGIPRQPVTPTTCIVVVDAPVLGLLGILADSVHDVSEVAASAILPVPDFGTVAPAEDLIGVVEIGGKLVLLLDTERVLSPEELLKAAAAPMAPAPPAAPASGAAA